MRVEPAPYRAFVALYSPSYSSQLVVAGAGCRTADGASRDDAALALLVFVAVIWSVSGGGCAAISPPLPRPIRS